MKHRHVFFDLDHTLWDFEKSSAETLIELFQEYEIGKKSGVAPEIFVGVFKEVNDYLWSQYQIGEISKEVIREQRFLQVFKKIGMVVDGLAHLELSRDYLMRCPLKPYLIEGSLEILEYLATRGYRLHVLTNGFSDVQDLKLKSSGINRYFEQVITSETIGAKKPDPEIFRYALHASGALLSESIMIGDGLETDIKGAVGMAMDCIFFNPSKTLHGYSLHADVSQLSEIKLFL
jgi:YjjG family noncanonical pyrimidine nucleotidase